MAQTIGYPGLLGVDYTPIIQTFWIVSWPDIAGISIPAFTAQTSKRPSWNFEEVEIHYQGIKRYIAGKITYDTFSVTLFDPIDSSASQEIVAWCSIIHDPNTGGHGYPSMYKHDINLELWDGFQNVIQKWTGKGAWPSKVDFGALDQKSGNPVEISLDIRADWWLLEF